jgi:hypothetical protein
MELMPEATPGRGGSGGSLVLVERVLDLAQALGLPRSWQELTFGHPSRRRSAYPAEHRLAAVLAGLAYGLRGVAPGNLWLRPSSALGQRLGGRFPDQGTVHRWLGQVTEDQAAALRHHLHEAVRDHGRFWQELWSDRLLVVDIDGQGLVARGRRFQRAHGGHLGKGMDRGYQRYVCYAGATHEVLDELLLPGNRTLMGALPDILAGLNEVLPRAYRGRVLIRADAHLGTAANVSRLRASGYHYLCPLYSSTSKRKLREQVGRRRGRWFVAPDSQGQERHLQYWPVRRWPLRPKGGRRTVRPRAVVYRERSTGGEEHWFVLLSDLSGRSARRQWEVYSQRGGTIEEYNDQSERAYHLEVMRTGNYGGLQALQCLVGLCWNLTRWAAEELYLPPLLAPQANRSVWVPAAGLDLAVLMQRAQQSGLRLYRESAAGPLEVEDTAQTPESQAWLRFLRQPIQLRLRLTG